jgi:hypothetical protein
MKKSLLDNQMILIDNVTIPSGEFNSGNAHFNNKQGMWLKFVIKDIEIDGNGILCAVFDANTGNAIVNSAYTILEKLMLPYTIELPFTNANDFYAYVYVDFWAVVDCWFCERVI